MKEGVAMPKALITGKGASSRLGLGMVAVLMFLSLVAGCGGATPEADSQLSPVADAQTSPLVPTRALAPTVMLSPTPVPTATPPAAPVQLTILHTNDNWGETEPCG
jgi:2',3'-cyclic-nucleotide 2'-phosphodiesterase (5'-nucleotidase family)